MTPLGLCNASACLRAPDTYVVADFTTADGQDVRLLELCAQHFEVVYGVWPPEISAPAVEMGTL